MTTEITNKRKTFQGEVVSDKMDKTVVVNVKSYVKHAKYGKFIKRSKRFKAHDEENAYHIGDTVLIEETKPFSKDKCYQVVAAQ